MIPVPLLLAWPDMAPRMGVEDDPGKVARYLMWGLFPWVTGALVSAETKELSPTRLRNLKCILR